MSNFYMISNHAITVIINDEQFTFSETQPFYGMLKDILSDDDENIDWDNVYELIHPKQALLNYTGKTITIEDNKFYYKSKTGKKIKLSENAIVSRIIELYENKKEYQYMVNFLDNVAANPDMTAINELFLFLEDCSLPITPDGYFLAYKAVRKDYYDHHSNKILNKPNTLIKMIREKVNNNRDETCSTGLHFCSKGYLENYNKNSSKIVIMKINPKDVVSIPSDYNNMKGRCCEYFVVGELDDRHSDIKKFINFAFPEKCSVIHEENPSEIVTCKFVEVNVSTEPTNIPVTVSVVEETKIPSTKEAIEAIELIENVETKVPTPKIANEIINKELNKKVKNNNTCSTQIKTDLEINPDTFATKENPYKGNCKEFVKVLPREKRELNRSYFLENSGKISEYQFIKTIGDRAFRRINIIVENVSKPTEKTLTLKKEEVTNKPEKKSLWSCLKKSFSKSSENKKENVETTKEPIEKVETLTYPDGTAKIHTVNGKTVKIEWEGNIKRFLRSFDKQKRVPDIDIVVKNSKFTSIYRFEGRISEDYLKKIK